MTDHDWLPPESQEDLRLHDEVRALEAILASISARAGTIDAGALQSVLQRVSHSPKNYCRGASRDLARAMRLVRDIQNFRDAARTNDPDKVADADAIARLVDPKR